MRIRLFALALVGAASACWVPIERGRQMEARLDRLEQDAADQQARLDEQRQTVKDRVAKVDQKIAEVQKKIDELNQAARRSGADLGVSINRLQEEMSRLKGDAEVALHRLDVVDQGLVALRTETEGKLAAMRGAGALDEYEAKQKIAALSRPDDKGAFLALAQKEEQSGDKGVARVLYQEYVRKWPSDTRTAEASFRAGEILFSQRRYREAILAYGKVAEDFPRSDRAADALVQVAESMLALDMKDDAKGILGQAVEKYPKTDAARRARARLEELSPPEPKKHSKKR
jgi:tol-pal system protein YbgF